MPDVVIPAELGGKRLDAAVKQLFTLSWNAARAAIETGKIALDGKLVIHGSVPVKAGSTITRNDNAKRPPRDDELRPEQIIHSDDHVIVVNKQAGLATVPIGNEVDTLDARVRRFLSKKSALRPELGVVHRLDKDTSGLVVFTRTWAAKESLTEQFRVHTVHRLYRAIVHGVPREGRIETMLVRDRGDGLRGSVPELGAPREAQKAVTIVEIEENFGKASLVRCRLHTGRTHQIRIHLSELGHPLVGEEVYFRDYKGPEIRDARLMLHASELGFDLPNGTPLRFTQEMPRDFQQLLQRLRDQK